MNEKGRTMSEVRGRGRRRNTTPKMRDKIMSEAHICAKCTGTAGNEFVNSQNLNNQKWWWPSGIKWYYRDDKAGIYIIHGDSREILPLFQNGSFEAIITDPVWPNASEKIIGHERPFELLAEVGPEFARLAARCVIHMGCNSDPRILQAISYSMPFLRVCWLEYAIPHCSGHILNGADVAYAFGIPPRRKEGRKVIPGKSPKAQPGNTCCDHPCSRALTFVHWLVSQFADDIILDPFMGSGTTLVAARNLGRNAVGIEIEEKYVEIAIKRLQQEVLW